jgi:hypothetical protein
MISKQSFPMKTLILLLAIFTIAGSVWAQSPVGNWWVISHTSSYGGQPFDSHKALLSQRPCAAKIVYRLTADGNYRLDASTSGCDESYVNIQQKLYSKTKWKLEGNKILTSATNFVVSQMYTISFKGDKMSWTSEQGDVITFQKLP